MGSENSPCFDSQHHGIVGPFVIHAAPQMQGFGVLWVTPQHFWIAVLDGLWAAAQTGVPQLGPLLAVIRNQ